MASELSPGFLVAAPSLLDPNFRRSVVLLVDHRPEGSLGFVINRPAPVEFAEVIDALGIDSGPGEATAESVLVGGPVAPETGWVLFEQGQPALGGEEVVHVSDTIGVSASRELLAGIVAEPRVKRFAVALGYAGWGPEQLDGEIAQGAWIPVDLDTSIVFDTPFSERWEASLRTLGIDPARLATVSPSGPS